MKKIIPGFTKYLASEDGFIFNRKSGYKLKFQKGGNYYTINISNNDNKSKNSQVHRLVAFAFLPNPNNLPVVNHKDGIGTNNCVNNLEWTTDQGNSQHAHENGLIDYYKRKVCQIDMSGSIIKTYESMADAEREIGIPAKSIVNVCKKRRRKTGGFYWKYEEEKNWKIPLRRSCKSVEKLDKNTGELIKTYESSKKAANDVGCTTASMCNALKGRLKTLKGYKWKYAPVEEVKKDSLYLESRKWEIIEGYPDYRISKDGRVYTDKRKKLRKLVKTPRGYHKIGITTNGIENKKLVHVLVAKAYVNNPNNCDRVYHKNRKRDDNRVENLEWRNKNFLNIKGEKINYPSNHPGKKAIIQYTKDGEEINRFDCISNAARSMGHIRYKDNISRVANRMGRNKTACGFIWRFENDSNKQDVTNIRIYTHKKAVIKCDKDGNELKKYESITDAQKDLGIKSSHIGYVCKGNRRTTLGYKWKYAD